MFSGPAFALGCLVALAASRVPFVKGTIYILLTIWTCWLGQICALCFLYPAFFIFPKIHKFFQRMMLSLWFSFNTFLMEKLIGINFVFYGDDIQDNGDYTSLAISNHHTAIDWLFLWVFFGRLRTLGNLKIVLKNELKFVPFFGWIMQVCRHAISPFLFSFSYRLTADTQGLLSAGQFDNVSFVTLTLGVQIHIFVSKSSEGRRIHQSGRSCLLLVENHILYTCAFLSQSCRTLVQDKTAATILLFPEGKRQLRSGDQMETRDVV